MREITADMYCFAEGYHDGRMGYGLDEPYDPDGYYAAGYEAGENDRSEQDERA